MTIPYWTVCRLSKNLEKISFDPASNQKIGWLKIWFNTRNQREITNMNDSILLKFSLFTIDWTLMHITFPSTLFYLSFSSNPSITIFPQINIHPQTMMNCQILSERMFQRKISDSPKSTPVKNMSAIKTSINAKKSRRGIFIDFFEKYIRDSSI